MRKRTDPLILSVSTLWMATLEAPHFTVETRHWNLTTGSLELQPAPVTEAWILSLSVTKGIRLLFESMLRSNDLWGVTK